MIKIEARHNVLFLSSFPEKKTLLTEIKGAAVNAAKEHLPQAVDSW